MKRYKTIFSSGTVLETNLSYEAINIQNYDDAQLFFLSDTPVTALGFFEAVRKAEDARLEKKEQTHKKVRMLHGSSAGNYVYKWIPIKGSNKDTK